ncbi:diacylglycerol/polyprenol kinase family protein [Oscillatoria sp. FACHB-1406]|uniref:diacylglycerol/polyprenol kinase family protein n=1 Tax=Oscillatoria sp. FACHB-1406 TaxID=2692846 RepID=UPI001685D633|nr:diacylglycerol/polyprenol kinase family protein [Oscillatoria sp. FACHB-1406]MBD2577036.1 phosphatidate cytidylyltransferase [Oscillatoria sp. FACHB-1406]
MSFSLSSINYQLLTINELFPIGLTTIYLILVIVIAEALNRLTHFGAEFTRKIVHIGAGQVMLFAWIFNIPAWVGIGAAAIAALVAIVSYFLPILPSINSVGRKSLGTFFYALSIGLLVAWFWPLQLPQYAAIGILVMAWGDGLAAVVGQRFGRHPYTLWGSRKSWEGTLVMAGVSSLVTFLILGAVQGASWQTAGISAAVGSFAALLEAFSRVGIDNLTVPLGSAALSFFLNSR